MSDPNRKPRPSGDCVFDSWTAATTEPIPVELLAAKLAQIRSASNTLPDPGPSTTGSANREIQVHRNRPLDNPGPPVLVPRTAQPPPLPPRPLRTAPGLLAWPVRAKTNERPSEISPKLHPRRLATATSRSTTALRSLLVGGGLALLLAFGSICN